MNPLPHTTRTTAGKHSSRYTLRQVRHRQIIVSKYTVNSHIFIKNLLNYEV